jgi:lipopolysaccharide biosynthesis glycosyltransferase
MNVFFCLSLDSPRAKMFAQMCLVAAYTAIKNGLQVWVLLEDDDWRLSEMLGYMGARVRFRQNPLKADIVKAHGAHPRLGSGTYLRFDLPHVADQLGIGGRILYADVDTMFFSNLAGLKDVPLDNFAFAFERPEPGAQLHNINAGVILMDVEACCRFRVKLLEFARENMHKYPHDQELLKGFIRDRVRWSDLPEQFNHMAWLPGQGEILHFHALKPQEANTDAWPDLAHYRTQAYLNNSRLWWETFNGLKEEPWYGAFKSGNNI